MAEWITRAHTHTHAMHISCAQIHANDVNPIVDYYYYFPDVLLAAMLRFLFLWFNTKTIMRADAVACIRCISETHTHKHANVKKNWSKTAQHLRALCTNLSVHHSRASRREPLNKYHSQLWINSREPKKENKRFLSAGCWQRTNASCKCETEDDWLPAMNHRHQHNFIWLRSRF